MKIHGYCTSCHRVKRVQVSNAGMMAIAQRRTPSGICDACQQTAGDKARDRNRRNPTARVSDRCPLQVGTRVRLIAMPDDPSPVAPGTTGVVTGGNGGQIWMKWDGGRTLSLIPGVDTWEVTE